MHIAIFSDVHGRIDLLFRLVARWEQETATPIDLILQAGDLGTFPEPEQMDAATRRYFEDDPTEMGVRDFIIGTQQTAETLARTSATMVFVRGNHEDHAWLDEREAEADGPTFPVDAAGRVHCLRTGIPWTFRADDGTSITLLGIGRTVATREPPPLHQIQPYEQRRLRNVRTVGLDLLLTHDSARDAVTAGHGMPEIAGAIRVWKPAYHVFGHVGDYAMLPTLDARGTRGVKAADLHWDQAGSLLKPPFVVLRWVSRQDHVLTPVHSSWLDDYGRWAWAFT